MENTENTENTSVSGFPEKKAPDVDLTEVSELHLSPSGKPMEVVVAGIDMDGSPLHILVDPDAPKLTPEQAVEVSDASDAVDAEVTAGINERILGALGVRGPSGADGMQMPSSMGDFFDILGARRKKRTPQVEKARKAKRRAQGAARKKNRK
jgi:hypothetical protein